VSRERLAALRDCLRQPTFARTGGLHATGLFTAAGEPVCACEDVGRRNAMDKLVGWALRSDLVPLWPYLLSSRATGGERLHGDRRVR